MAMKFGNFDTQSVITQPSTVTIAAQQFAPLDSSSVIKTAPPGSRHEFVSPKQEPLETSLQDLGKMQPTAIDYYSMQNYQRVYSANEYLIQPTSNLIQNGPGNAALYYNTLPGTFATADWSASAQRPMEYYPRATYQNAEARGLNGDLPSPVDSGIGADLSLLAANGVVTQKDDTFYITQNSSAPVPQEMSVIERPERTLSHRDSPVVIAKIHNRLGFQYVLEAPISTSIRKDDDRMTYVNKGQYYNVVLSYIPDHQKPLQSKTVRTCLLLAFREDKTYEKEMETWCKWHKDQQNRRQRIIDYDLKNSSGFIGPISEPALNAIEFYWDPTEGPVKFSLAVQCLSTDFSPQKGVKGWPMHLQIDTFDDENSKIPFHRGFCQIKVFCDKGAERKLRDEDKRAQKRKTQQVTGRKKTEGEFHEPCDKSEFYHMSDLDRTAALFHGSDHPFDQQFLSSPVVDHFAAIPEPVEPVAKRPRIAERIMLYARRSEEMVFEPLHVVPPSVSGLIGAVSTKFGIDVDKVGGLYKRCRKGVTVKMDDEMVKHYCNEDTFQIEIEPMGEDRARFSVLFVEIETSAATDYNPN